MPGDALLVPVLGPHCWDLNGNGLPDLGTEDINGDFIVDVQDCAGPAGPDGGIIIDVDGGFTATNIGIACTAFPNLNVTLTVSGPGTIIVQSTVVVRLEHASGSLDNVWVSVADPIDCTLTPSTGLALVSNLAASGLYYETVPLLRVFNVTSAGNYSFGVNALSQAGWSLGDLFVHGTLLAVYYP